MNPSCICYVTSASYSSLESPESPGYGFVLTLEYSVYDFEKNAVTHTFTETMPIDHSATE